MTTVIALAGGPWHTLPSGQLVTYTAVNEFGDDLVEHLDRRGVDLTRVRRIEADEAAYWLHRMPAGLFGTPNHPVKPWFYTYCTCGAALQPVEPITVRTRHEWGGA